MKRRRSKRLAAGAAASRSRRRPNCDSTRTCRPRIQFPGWIAHNCFGRKPRCKTNPARRWSSRCEGGSPQVVSQQAHHPACAGNGSGLVARNKLVKAADVSILGLVLVQERQSDLIELPEEFVPA